MRNVSSKSIMTLGRKEILWVVREGGYTGSWLRKRAIYDLSASRGRLRRRGVCGKGSDDFGEGR